jgi:hypothetical protein
MPTLTLATRKSPLALAQTGMVAAVLRASLGVETAELRIVTTGDRQTEWSLEKKGGKGLFTSELEAALLRGEADVAVHSTKDLPGEMAAGLAIAGYQTTDKARALAIVAAAEGDFDTALARDPASVPAQLQKAVAIAYRAQLTRGIALAKETRRRFETIRAAHPDNSLVWGALGGWHGGAVATVGSFLAGTALGAKKSEMERCYAQALKLAPGLPSTRVFFAITLLDLDAGNATRAAGLLKGLENLPTQDGFETLLKRQGLELASVLAKGDAAAAQATARKLKAFSRIV